MLCAIYAICFIIHSDLHALSKVYSVCSHFTHLFLYVRLFLLNNKNQQILPKYENKYIHMNIGEKGRGDKGLTRDHIRCSPRLC